MRQPFRTWAGNPLSAANCFSTNPLLPGLVLEKQQWKRKLLSIVGWYEDCNIWEIWQRRKQYFEDDLVQLIGGSGVARQQ